MNHRDLAVTTTLAATLALTLSWPTFTHAEEIKTVAVPTSSPTQPGNTKPGTNNSAITDPAKQLRNTLQAARKAAATHRTNTNKINRAAYNTAIAAAQITLKAGKEAAKNADGTTDKTKLEAATTAYNMNRTNERIKLAAATKTANTIYSNAIRKANDDYRNAIATLPK